MELIFDFDQRQGIANVRFEGLDGTEGVTSTKQALSLLKIRNPACAFADAVKTGAYDDLSDAEYKRLLEAVTCISSLWHRPGDQPDSKTQYDMNPLTLLANTIEALSQLNAQCQTQEPEQP